MGLSKLYIKNIRNISEQKTSFSNKFNVFWGANGSGKTSILEAIYLLGFAKTFRNNLVKKVITHGQEACAVYGEIISVDEEELVKVGFSRTYNGIQETKLNGLAVERSALLEVLPIKMINNDTFSLLLGPSLERRKFLDWGVWGANTDFLSIWKKYQRALKQRNYQLKIGMAGLDVWEQELVRYGERLHQMRAHYFLSFEPLMQQQIALLLPDYAHKLQIRYTSGWGEGSLAQALIKSRSVDLLRGFTTQGPHRADFSLKLDDRYAKDILSRGQMKLLVSALITTQLCLQQSMTHMSPLILIDDLIAELDADAVMKILGLLQRISAQIFITVVELPDKVLNFAGEDARLFHVEHGKIADWV